MKSPENQNRPFMTAALKEAQKAFDKHEVPVGAVVVKDGKIIARAHNLRETAQTIEGHAEFLAMRKAAKKIGSWRLEGCDVYVTMEPCPMCAGAMIQSRIRKVYYAVSDPKAGVAHSMTTLFDLPFNHHVDVEGGLMALESKALLQSFFKALRQK
ncbi:MAG: nucleoside deaminase [Acholeplasmataceae bacterium]|nr:nucleoside deaminase [Acholeplasmataceae bacterium]